MLPVVGSLAFSAARVLFVTSKAWRLLHLADLGEIYILSSSVYKSVRSGMLSGRFLVFDGDDVNRRDCSDDKEAALDVNDVEDYNAANREAIACRFLMKI